VWWGGRRDSRTVYDYDFGRRGDTETHVTPAAKLVPVIVTAVPPFASPVFGLTEATVGPEVGAVPPVVKLQTGPVAVKLAIVLETIFHR